MKFKTAYVIFAIGVFISVYADAALATPMRCSDEQKACTAICNKIREGTAHSTCITNCRTRQATCLQTGCWITSSNRYCNMMKQ
jgi:hypothetical protein